MKGALVMKLFEKHKKEFDSRKTEILSLEDYLKKARKDSSCYASAAERMLKAIGEPKLLDTSKSPTLRRIFNNRLIKSYEVFKDFYGMEEVIERLVSFFKHAAQGLEESRQILYLLGPVGSAKSSLAERLKELMEQEPIYVLADSAGRLSPIYESPLGLFSVDDAEELKIPKHYLEIKPSPWALKRLEEAKGDLTQFKVIKMFPSQDRQIAISKTEPGDDNNQDISTLVGSLNIRKIEKYNPNDTDAYSYSGGLCLANQGLLEFVEMFKAPIKVLHPLLTATQERNYKGTEAISAIPFDGIIVAHSNESEWNNFKSNKNNEAFLDRIYIVEVPYCLRISEEIKIYKKLLENSTLIDAPTAPGTLDMLAELCVASRLDVPTGDNYKDNLSEESQYLVTKMRVYNGENLKDKDINAAAYQQYKDLATKDEGFYGLSTRLAYKILSEVYNYDPMEIAADPVHMLYVMEKTIKNERLSKEEEEKLLLIIKDHLTKEYKNKIGKDIQTCFLECYDEFGQSTADRYIEFADNYIQDVDFRDHDTGQMYDKQALNQELEKLEKPAGIANPKDFRSEIVNFALRYQAKHDGKNPDWKAYEKLRQIIESNMFNKTEDLLPIISFSAHTSSENKAKHRAFVERMEKLGYTNRQVKRLVEWHQRVSKS